METTTSPLAQQLAKHFRDVHFGGNWCVSTLKQHLDGVTWQQATTQVHDFNTIATLVYHMHYYVAGVSKVLDGEPLNTKDELSFNHPPIQSEADWQNMLNLFWADAEKFAAQIEQLPEAKLWETFTAPAYGNYFRNLQGITEHMHYHLGQIVLIKKLL